MSRPYLVNLDLEGRPVVVVGAGRVAARKVRGLLKAGAQVTVIAPLASRAILRRAQNGGLLWLRRPWRPEDADRPALLVFAATNDAGVNADIVKAVRARGRLANGVDRSSGRDFSTPATARIKGLTVAVSSGNPAKSKAACAGALETLRRCRLRPGLRKARPGVTLVGAGPGDPELLTLGGRHALEQAEVVVYDHLVSPAVLALAPQNALRISAEKLPYGPQVTQETINSVLVREGSLGKRVVRLKGGDPFIFGRGAEEIEALHRAGVPFKVIPGVSALNGVTGAAGLALTSRGRNHGFAVVSAAPPTPDREFARWATVEGPVVVFMGVGRAGAISREMIAAGRPDAEPVTVIARGGCEDERIKETTLSELPVLLSDVEAWTPALIVIGARREAAFAVGKALQETTP